jgi:hypothetical protein
MTTNEPEEKPSHARRFNGIKFYNDDRGPETGEVGRLRILRYAEEDGLRNDRGEPDFSEMVRRMCTAEALRRERARARQARKAQTSDAAMAQMDEHNAGIAAAG